MSSTPHTVSSTPRSALTGLQCHLCKAIVSSGSDLRLRQVSRTARAGLRLRQRSHVTREEIERRPKNLWRYRELLPITGEPLTGFNSGFTPLVRCDRLAERLGPPRAVPQRRLGQSSDAVVQGPRRLDRGDARRRARLQGDFVRLDRQPRQQRLGARRAARPRMLRVHSRQPRAGQDSRVGDLSSDDSRHRRQLRRRESAVHAGGRSLRLGIRQHQPALLLRRRREDDGVRDRRAARLALSAARRVAGRRRHAAAAHPSRIPRARRRSVSSRASCRAFTRRRRPAARRSCRRSRAGLEHPELVRPDTIAKSIAIGNPADGYQVLESVRSTGGTGAAVTDKQISTRFSCWPRPRASSPSRPAAPRLRPPSIWSAAASSAPTNRPSSASPATATRRRM